ncbi:RNA polymerase sigma factor [Allorhizobium undicola]|uniref:RNA polymerase sigma factor n=1 Tax=Allorhizobium undicola TaxID=78527 RepID=UPI000486057B|nr:sigma-70 family RNA polymerase sigma factor [Allorhizobium undicola]
MDNSARQLDLVFLENQKGLNRLMRRIVQDASIAEELTQEAYLRARKALESNTPERLEPFLWRTARNLALDHLRRHKLRSALEKPGVLPEVALNAADSQPSVEERAIHRDDLRAVREALEKLPPRAREIWVLSRLEGWSYPRIAEHLGMSPNTVFNDIKMTMGYLVELRRRLER